MVDATMLFSPKKVIPRLALAALPLNGVGCGDGSATATEQLNQGISAFCMKSAECRPQDPLFPTVEQCVEDYVAEYSVYSDGCKVAIASYFQCLGGLTCDEYMNDYEQCYDAAVEAINRNCDFVNDPS